jgi:hypothetical protein
VIVRNFNVHRPFWRPVKANPKLVIDPNRILSSTVTGERLQPIAGWCSKVTPIDGCIKIAELTPRDLDQIGWETLRTLAPKDSLSPPVAKASDHLSYVSIYDTYVKEQIAFCRPVRAVS